jgi:hypothetical protein
VIILDTVLMTLIATGIVSFLVWSICTQYRHAGCEHLRIRRRLRVSVRLVTLDEPQIVPSTRIAL